MKNSDRIKTYLRPDDQDDSELVRTRMGDRKSFWYLLKIARPHWKTLIWSLLLVVSGTGLTLVNDRLTGYFVEHALLTKNWQTGVAIALLIFCIGLIWITFWWMGRKILIECSLDIIVLIRKKMFEFLQELPMSYYDREPQGRIVTRITHDVEGIEDFFTSSLGIIIWAMISIVMSSVAMMLTNFWLGSIMTLAMLPSMLMIYVTRKDLRQLGRNSSKISSIVNAMLSEFLDGLKMIHAFGLERWIEKSYLAHIIRYREANLAINTHIILTRPLMSLLCVFPLILLVYFGGQGVFSSEISVGVFVAFIGYFERFLNPVITISREIQVIQTAFTSAERVAAFLSTESEENTICEGTCTTPINGKIQISNLGMYYNASTWILRSLDISITPGEKIGLVGPTGCGKTTIVALLARLYEFQEGEILIDTKSIRDYRRDHLRNSLGFVAQNVIIFKGTLRENLMMDSSFSQQLLIEAAEKTGLNRIMERNNLQFDSEILENGANLSVGERQILAFTRILLKNPRILILDEATANVDEEYEELVHEAVVKVMQGRTCLIIAHRLNTLKICDRILSFEDGSVLERTLDEITK